MQWADLAVFRKRQRWDPMMIQVCNREIIAKLCFSSHLSCYYVPQPYVFGFEIGNGYVQTKNKIRVKQINSRISKYQMSIDMVA